METQEPAELDWYRVLGVSKEATVDDIKRAFRKLALIYHPDKATGKPDASFQFLRV